MGGLVAFFSKFSGFIKIFFGFTKIFSGILASLLNKVKFLFAGPIDNIVIYLTKHLDVKDFLSGHLIQLIAIVIIIIIAIVIIIAVVNFKKNKKL